MHDIKKSKRAAIYSNRNFICINTMSGYGLFVSDPYGAEYFLEPDVADSELGSALLDALSRSRFMIPKQYYRSDVWIHPEAVVVNENYDLKAREQRYDDWVMGIKNKYQIKTKRAIFKDMRHCLVKLCDGTLTIDPTNHERLEAWSGDGISEEDYVVLPDSSSPEEVGKGIRLALSRCI